MFLLHRKHNVSCAQKTVFLSFAYTRKCFLFTENSVSFICLDNQVFLVHRKHSVASEKKESLFFVHRNNFVVSAKERNTVLYAQETLYCLSKRKKHFVVYAQETLYCLGKRKKYCFLCTKNTLLSWQRKEKLFPVHKKHFVVLAKERNTVSYFSAKERNTVFYAQETLCCLGKRKKNCFLYIGNTLLSWQKKETLFSMYKKHFVVLAKERNERNTVFCA